MSSKMSVNSALSDVSAGVYLSEADVAGKLKSSLDSKQERKEATIGLRPKPCHILLTPFLNNVGCMRCGPMLLKGYSIFSKCGINPGIQFLLQHPEINMLVNFYSLINEKEESFLDS